MQFDRRACLATLGTAAAINGGWSTLNLTTEGAPPFRVCFLKGWAIPLFALSHRVLTWKPGTDEVFSARKWRVAIVRLGRGRYDESKGWQ
jgi:hypothetical protein